MTRRIDELRDALRAAASAYFAEAAKIRTSDTCMVDLSTKEELAAGTSTLAVRRRPAADTLAAKTFGA